MPLKDVIYEQVACLVSVQRHVFTVRISDFYSEAVGVWICCKKQFSAGLPAVFLTQLESLRILRIRISHRRKIRIRLILLRHYRPIRKSPVGKHLPERYRAAAIQRGVNDWNREVELITRMDCERLNPVEIHTVVLIAKDSDYSGFNHFVIIRSSYSVTLVYFFNALGHRVSDFGRNLASVIPVCLIAVVFLRVV